MLSQFAYISNEKIQFSENDLQELLSKARKKNKDMDLTGLLLYDKGTFLQILEGPERSIEEMKKTIFEDIRHQNMDIVYETDRLLEREFANWQMGFQILGSHNNEDYGKLDSRVRQMLERARPNGKEAYALIAEYKKLKNSYVNLNRHL